MDTIGKYQIIEELGRGGMGVIYKALDPDIHRTVAIKVIRKELLSGSGPQSGKALKRFMVEAQAAGRLTHPHIATIYEVGRHEDQTFIVMQYIAGQSLRKRLDAGRAFSAEEAADLAVPICQALDYAHRSGVVHRDIKPDNILLDGDGKPYLVDFGIATVESVDVTKTSTVMATPAYQSPEQVLGEPIDARSDIFSFGIVLYEMLAGQRPFAGQNSTTVALKIVKEEPPELVPKAGALPEGFAAVVLRALAKRPEDRWASAGEMAEAIQESARSEQETTVIKTQPRATLPRTAARRKPRAGRWPAWLRSPAGTAAGIAIAAAALFGLLVLGRKLLVRPASFENLITVAPFAYKTRDLPDRLIEFALDRALTASTRIPVLSGDGRELAAGGDGIRARKPLARISGTVVPTLTGFDVDVTIIHKGVKSRKAFPCKGSLDLISSRIEEILAFLKSRSDGDIGSIEGGRSFAAICTANWDALTHYLKARAAWDKLESKTAAAELKTALEYDPDFALARLKAAEVDFFQDDRVVAQANAEEALADAGRLIGYDTLRLKALLARIESRPAEERGFLMQLKEAFPGSREYLYEFAESYFHTGDGAEAIPYYAKALDLDGSYALAHNHIAFCYAWTGDHAKADEHFRRYVELDKTANSYDSMASGLMFAGRYAEAVAALDKGKALDDGLYYLYSNYATNFALTGALAKAEESLRREADAATGDSSRFDIQFERAHIAALRGDAAKAEELLRPALEYYGGKAFADRLDESPIRPIWLSGCLAAKRGDKGRLRASIADLARRAAAKGLNAANYFPVLKFLAHLRAWQARLERDRDGVLREVEEAQRFEPKMGYWTSPFDRAYFLDEYARLIQEVDPASAKPKELLGGVLAYNASYPPALLRMARLLKAEGDADGAKRLHDRARAVLAGADADSLLAKELGAVGTILGVRP